MNWKNLKSNKCPKCELPLKDIGEYMACSKCIFSINKEKFEKIVNDLYKPYTKSKDSISDDNLSELNNLGHEKVAEDFSDSPFLDN